MKKILLSIFIIVIAVSCQDSNNNKPENNSADNSVPLINYSVVGSSPHDTSAYTEGFLFHDGQLYESTGFDDGMPENRLSSFGVVDMKTGKIQVKVEIDKKKYFGEGIVFLNNKVYQLTWKSKIGFIYDSKTFKKIGEFTFPSDQGWGMTTNGADLIMSDGSSNISYIDPNNITPEEVKIHYSNDDSTVKTLNNFRLVKTLNVSDNNGPVADINELELINGYIYANQYKTNYILKIDTTSGKVVGKLDFTTLDNEAKTKNPDAAEMNGIAYDPVAKKVYVTGKLWPNIYEVKFNF